MGLSLIHIWHDDVGVAVGLLGAFLQFIVQLPEAIQSLLLVGEHLDDLLALDVYKRQACA